jgi:hypothetical protein
MTLGDVVEKALLNNPRRNDRIRFRETGIVPTNT